MALAGNVVVGDAIAEGVVTVPQKASEVSWAEAAIIVAAATKADVNVKETIVGVCGRAGFGKKSLRGLHYERLVQTVRFVCELPVRWLAVRLDLLMDSGW